jgi:3-deoxy-D-manno-octulosonate 8-phosphate phosphatase (KDO 8-P phosphatase)
VSVIIKLLILDVDGTLTDGTIVYGSGGTEVKSFSAKDGLILRVLPQMNIDVVFLTGRESKTVKRRASELGAIAIQGVGDKSIVLCELITKRKIVFEHCAYIGDDLNDFAAMKLCAFKACPADAVEEIRNFCDYVSIFKGGHGAVRDVCEFILKQDGKKHKLLDFYG